jgi:hypothetical protein
MLILSFSFDGFGCTISSAHMGSASRYVLTQLNSAALIPATSRTQGLNAMCTYPFAVARNKAKASRTSSKSEMYALKNQALMRIPFNASVEGRG